MKAFIAALILVIAIGAAAGWLMAREEEPAYAAFATSGARVDNPGHNLVGPNWSGLNNT